jgi:calmodulin
MALRESTKFVIQKNLDIPEDKLQEYKEAFDMFDKDGSGQISVEEIQSVFKNMGNELTTQEVKEMIRDLDDDQTGEINFEEFITLMQRTMETELITEEEEVIRAFQTFDKDHSGTLSCSEFKHILTNLGDRFTDEEVNEIFKEADLDHDGVITYREFVDFWKNK